MRGILFILLSLGITNLFAQVTLTRSNCSHNLTDTYKVKMSDPMQIITNIDPTPAGENITWDFSTMNADFTESSTSVCVDPATTPFADSATHATVCIKNQDKDTGPYQYLSITDDKLELVGIGWHEAEGNSYAHYNPALTSLDFPTNYGSTLQQEFVVDMITTQGIRMIDSSSVTVIADAWGTVITPEATYDNVLRLKRTTVSTTYMSGGGVLVPAGAGTIIDYEWFKPGIPTTVINVSKFEGDAGYTAVYLTNHTHNAVHSTMGSESLPELYPNPCRNRITISTEGQAISNIEVYTNTGQLVYDSPYVGNKINISTSSLKPGIYLTRVICSDKVYTRKFIKE